MQQLLRLCIAAFAAVVLVYAGGLAVAQPSITQIALTDKQIEGFIAANDEIAEVFEQMSDEKSDAVIKARLDVIAKKFGFKDHNDYDAVGTNIAMVMYGMDPETKAFTDPPVLAKRKLDEATADKGLSEKERKQLVDELTEELKAVQTIAHPGNIELVKKYYDKIEPLLQ